MTQTTRWVIDTAYAANNAGFTATDFNSLANGSCAVATSAIGNSSNLDIIADLSFSFVVGGTTSVSSYMSLFLLPLNQDASTYGDAAATGSTPPVASYQVAQVGVKSGVTSGNAIVGSFRGIILPPGNFKFCIVNNLGVALNASAASAVAYRTYNENLNA